MKTYIRWAILCRSENRLDGKREYLRGSGSTGMSMLFKTRQEARNWNEQAAFTIRTRPDLRAEPHGWKVPKVVKVKVTIEEIKPKKKNSGPSHDEFIKMVKTSMKRPEAQKAAKEATEFLKNYKQRRKFKP